MSDGLQLRDFALVSDVGRAVAELAISAAAPKHRVFNLGSGILPGTPVASMEAVFRTLRARRPGAPS